MSMYTAIIVEICKVDAAEAALIEFIMRQDQPVLEGLTNSQFDRLASLAQRDLKDPDIRETVSALTWGKISW